MLGHCQDPSKGGAARPPRGTATCRLGEEGLEGQYWGTEVGFGPQQPCRLELRVGFGLGEESERHVHRPAASTWRLLTHELPSGLTQAPPC